MIEFKNIKKSYGDSNILNNISFSIKQGDCVAFMGESGSGKSTILNIIGLLDDYDSGSYTLFDKEVKHLSNKEKTKLLRHKIGYIFQNFALIEDETVLNNLMLSIMDSSNKNKKMKQILNVLEIVGLKDKLNNKIYQLSGGEQQRIAIARILLRDSAIILADEPTGSLDHKNKQIILKLLAYLSKLNKTLIIVTHDEEVARWCNKIYYLK
jgi:putative ABC transport system ATP-binding protein